MNSTSTAKDQLISILEKSITRIIRDEIREIVRSELRMVVNELKSSVGTQLNESVAQHTVSNQVVRRPAPVLSQNATLQSLLADTFDRSAGGNENVPTTGQEVNFYSAPQNQIVAPNLGGEQALSLHQAIPSYEGDMGGSGEQGGLKPVGNPVQIIESSPGLARALTRDYRSLLKAVDRKKRGR